MSRKKKFGISHSDERNLKSGAPLRCKPAAMLEDAEQWGSDKGVRGRLRDGGAREQEGWVLKLPNGRETRKRKGDFERARRVANRNEGPVYGFKESYEAAKAYGEAAISERTCREWFQRFKNGDFDVQGHALYLVGPARRSVL
ncbi:hypothetical protein ALC53_12938 [Atta colombica]|uniref:Mos1 transposase HTH domain-containing protein n=1 Tax=Atta colombica TaxID=520822 RepID=A0A151HY66_9HYME|nr:hypothetical protein ALC53_12938 [Atta colombica]